MRRSVLAFIAAAVSAGVALGGSAVAGAAPVCPQPKVFIQGEIVNTPRSQVCDDDPTGNDGLLGNAPVVGNLPGLGGVL
jgi:hypothetical protein